MTLDRQLRALNAINDLGSQIRITTLGRELGDLNNKNDFGSWMR